MDRKKKTEVGLGQISARPHVDWSRSGNVDKTSPSLMIHIYDYLPCVDLGGPDMFLRSALWTFKAAAPSIHHADWQRIHPTSSRPPSTVKRSILRSSSIYSRMPIFSPPREDQHPGSCLCAIYKPSCETSTLLSLSPSACIKTDAIRASGVTLNKYFQLSRSLIMTIEIVQSF